MKEKELREHANCSRCSKPIGNAGLMFQVVTTKTYLIDVVAAHRQTGLGMQIGGALAMVMGPDEDLAEEVSSNQETVCQNCMFADRAQIRDGG